MLSFFKTQGGFNDNYYVSFVLFSKINYAFKNIIKILRLKKI